MLSGKIGAALNRHEVRNKGRKEERESRKKNLFFVWIFFAFFMLMSLYEYQYVPFCWSMFGFRVGNEPTYQLFVWWTQLFFISDFWRTSFVYKIRFCFDFSIGKLLLIHVSRTLQSHIKSYRLIIGSFNILIEWIEMDCVNIID